jgi:hypothetical protein
MEESETNRTKATLRTTTHHGNERTPNKRTKEKRRKNENRTCQPVEMSHLMISDSNRKQREINVN